MGSAAVRMTRKRSVQTFLVLLFCLVPQSPARNLHHTKLTIGNVELLRPYLTGDLVRNANGCELCLLWITEFACNDLTPANLAQCQRYVCPRCSYCSHCLPEWCPLPTTTSPPTPSTTRPTPPTDTLLPTTKTSPEPADASSATSAFMMS